MRRDRERTPAPWPRQADPASALLRRGLEAARSRTGDEITRRRIWASLAARDKRPRVQRRLRWQPLAILGGIVLLALGATWGTLRGGRQLALETRPAPHEPVAKTEDVFVQGPAEIATGGNETMRLRLRGGAKISLGMDTRVALDEHHRPTLRKGQVTLEVPKQAPGRRFALLAGPYRITVIGTRFTVNQDLEQVGVTVEEGVVEVEREGRRVRLEAGQSWSGWLRPGAPAAPSSTPSRAGSTKRTSPPRAARPAGEPASASESAALHLPAEAPKAAEAPLPGSASPAPDWAQEARAALRAGDPDRALALWGRLAQRPGVAGETAVYEMGRIWRDHKLQPRRALLVWERYREEHPHGLLRPEVDLSIVETHARLQDEARAMREARAFLTRHPRSERRGEVEALLRALEGRTGAP